MFEEDILPMIGERDINEIEPMQILSVSTRLSLARTELDSLLLSVVHESA